MPPSTKTGIQLFTSATTSGRASMMGRRVSVARQGGRAHGGWLVFPSANFIVPANGEAYHAGTSSTARRETAMKTIRTLAALLLVLATTAPARADFQSTETSQLTGCSLLKMMKFASVFARGDNKKQEKQMLDATATTHYVKGGRLRTDNADGTAQIIDVENQRVIVIDMNKKTYAVATFDQIKAAMEQAQQQMQAQIQQNPQQQQAIQNAQLKITPTIHVTPGAGNRVILNQPTNETKVEIDLVMQATATGPDAPPPGQPNSGTGTYSMNTDTFVAPSVSGYLEFAKFYRRMADEVNWMKLPAMNIQIADPRVTQGMSELQKNSDALKGFPMLSYVSMTISATANGQPVTTDSQNGAQNQPPANPPPSQTQSGSSSNNSIPTSASSLAVKGLGSLFGKKKQQDNSSTPSNQAGAPAANPNSDPNALMEMTTQVTAFSDSSLDGSVFDVPAGYMQMQEDPMQVFGGGRSQQQQPNR